MSFAFPLNRSVVTAHPSAIETGILELFAPKLSSKISETRSSGHLALWRSDAIHRAKNLAQLALSLANVGEDPWLAWLSPPMAAQSRGLSRIFEELGAESDPRLLLPCDQALTEVVTRLTGIFGRARNIESSVISNPVRLPADERRALILICSELVINALKYAFIGREGGTIRVGLHERADRIELVVEDDGIGMNAGGAAGRGSGLVDQLAGILNGSLVRTPAPGKGGYRVAVYAPSGPSRA